MKYMDLRGVLQCGTLVCIALAMVSCGGGNPVPTPPVTIYKALGSLQCTGGGVSLSTIVKQLTDAGIAPLSSSCGHDGLDRIAVCGVPDGRIAMVDVAQEQITAAQALGFAPLATLPMAVKITCI